MGAFIGFILGYVVGVRAGHEKYEEIIGAWGVITRSKEFVALMDVVMSITKSNAVGGKASELEQAWKTVSNSPEFADALLSGTTVLGRFLKNGAAGRAFGGQLKSVVTELMKSKLAA